MDEIETFYSDTSSNYIPDAETLKNEYKFPVKIERGWEVKEDGSLGDRGMEISTGIYQVKDLINIIEKVFK
jgi:hypothetical protein